MDALVAQVTPLTGPWGAQGAQAAAASRLYFDYINATGGLRGRRIRHLVLDDGGQAAATLRLAQQALERHGALVLFGVAGSTRLLDLLAEEVLEKAGAPLVNPPAREPGTRLADSGWVFRFDAALPLPERPCVPAVREYHTLLKRHPGAAAPTPIGVAHFLGAKLLVEALQRAGPRPSRATLLAALEAMDQCDLGGVTVQQARQFTRQAA